jgi:hypothetical protein
VIKRCDGSVFETGYYIPAKTFVHLALSYDGNNMIFYENGQMVNMARKLLTFSNYLALDIGYYASQNNEFFNGEIEYVQIYRQVLAQSSILQLSTIPAEKFISKVIL